MVLSAQPEFTSVKPQNSNRLNRLLRPILTFILGVILGFSVSFVFLDKRESIPEKIPVTPAPKEQLISASQLPIGLDLLKNPIVNQWRGAVEGTLVAKDSDTITIKDERGNSLAIPSKLLPDTKEMMTFVDYTSSDSAKRGKVSLDNIPLGTRLRGDFFVVPGDKDKIIGGLFTVIEYPKNTH